MMAGSIIGGAGQLLGSGLQAVSGYIAAREQRQAARKMRRALSEAIRESKGVIDLESRTERERALRAVKRSELEGQRALRQAGQRAEASLFNAMASPAYQAQAGYLQAMFTQGIPAPLAEEMTGRIRGAQTARGFRGGGATIQNEARALAAEAARQRQALLPQLRQLALDPMMLRREEVAGRLQAEAAAQGIGLAQLQGQTGALQAAQQMAAARFGPYTSILGSLTAQMPYSAASPAANALLAAGQGLSNFGQSFG